jgi:NTE family protein
LIFLFLNLATASAAIIAGSKGDHPGKELEQFWLELADGDTRLSSPSVDWFAKYPAPVPIRISQAKSTFSFYRSAFHGKEKVFVPRWSPGNFFSDPQYLTPGKWTYLFDHSPLVKTMEKYVDFNKLQPNGNLDTRLIITAVNVLTAEPIIFDSAKQQITPKHILATTGYPTYYFQWVEVEKGVYAWDGSLLSNTPLREVIDASPMNDKRIFLVENYPKNIDKLPDNILEVQH